MDTTPHLDPLQDDTWKAQGLWHGFFNRFGGVSHSPYESLNTGLLTDDAASNVATNRGRVASWLGVTPEHLLGAEQVHGARVLTVRGALATESWRETVAKEKADALVSDDPAFVLSVVTADCVPVLLATEGGAVVGAAHAGWRGAVGGVLENTVAAMVDLGAVPATVQAVVGPAIGPASYETGADMRSAVLDGTPGVAQQAAAHLFTPAVRSGHFMFNLPAYVALRLRLAGVDAVRVMAVDTVRDGRFFSYRRTHLTGGGPTGRQLSAIRARPA
ncbi:peptidoglycan editing factor PgeF [Formicincola oecophyllae]|uniref:Purine nucleoside phosphorylase n=1 Tax=Formicincola oecophyllae TaxID=2558361 RepID=A0A4Y6UA74_9PROT|nr:peptidoglycan editing factor PgeF [Formicincola oecophyllae]QDH13478.1 peptidoglycan editing factor PgeF [Formicincola oecophyllae]